MSTTELTWFKSSYSSSGDGDCIEVALDWHKSSYSSGDGDDCVEVASCPAAIHVRDSKNPHGPQLALDPTTWGDFLRLVRAAP
ncbi:toxin [Streptomyces aureoverticillatus]|nr:toxin [Streptomyces aureoverticillatus]